MLCPFARAAGLLRFAEREVELQAQRADPESAVRILNLLRNIRSIAPMLSMRAVDSTDEYGIRKI
jgi:hypothetical protein